MDKVLVSLNEARDWAKEKMRPKRFEHTLRVMSQACEIAKHWNVDTYKAALSALLHDNARDLGLDKLLKLVKSYKIKLTCLEKSQPVLLHASVGAELARVELGIEDEVVLNAVRYHTTARARMAMLEKTIYLADYTEPERSFAGIEKVRRLVFEDVNDALKTALDQSIVYVVKRKRLIHPRTVDARNWLYENCCT